MNRNPADIFAPSNGQHFEPEYPRTESELQPFNGMHYEDAAGDVPEAKAGPVLVRMSDVEARPVDWLWPNRIVSGGINLVVGMPGEGKSFFCTDLAARISTGSPLPDGSGNAPLGSVLMCNAEDDPGYTTRPRLDAHHADCNRIHLLPMVRRVNPENGEIFEATFTLQDVYALDAAMEMLGDCKAIFIDPIGSYLGGRVDAHRDNEVRGVLAPVAALGAKYGAAIIMVAHRRKGAAVVADDLVLGSRAFTGIARSVLHLSRDKQNPERRLLLPGKCNLGPDVGGLAFSIAGDPPALVWERNPVLMRADDALADEDEEGGAREEAAEWLANELKDMQEHPVAALKDSAKRNGIAWRTAQRAATSLHVKRHRATFGGGMAWRLPRAGHTCHDGTEGTNGTYGTTGTNGESA